MPYRRKGAPKTTTRKSRSHKSYPYRTNLKQQIRKEVFKLAEPKYIQTDLSTSISNSGTFLACALINQGDYSTDRVGNKVIPTSWTIRGSIVGADNFNFVRMVVLQWNDDNLLNPPLLTQVFENTSGNSSLYSTFNRQQIGTQYRVLSDKLFRVSANTANPDINSTRLVKSKGWKGLKEMTFQGSATTGAGQIYVLLISDSSLPSHPSFEGFSIINYRDL